MTDIVMENQVPNENELENENEEEEEEGTEEEEFDHLEDFVSQVVRTEFHSRLPEWVNEQLFFKSIQSHLRDIVIDKFVNGSTCLNQYDMMTVVVPLVGSNVEYHRMDDAYREKFDFPDELVDYLKKLCYFPLSSNFTSFCGKKPQDHSCPICFLPVEPANFLLTTCSHVFHVDCINTWRKQNNSCPVCRKTPAEAMNIENPILNLTPE